MPLIAAFTPEVWALVVAIIVLLFGDNLIARAFGSVRGRGWEWETEPTLDAARNFSVSLSHAYPEPREITQVQLVVVHGFLFRALRLARLDRVRRYTSVHQVSTAATTVQPRIAAKFSARDLPEAAAVPTLNLFKGRTNRKLMDLRLVCLVETTRTGRKTRLVHKEKHGVADAATSREERATSPSPS
jgi:hypothetical protein